MEIHSSLAIARQYDRSQTTKPEPVKQDQEKNTRPSQTINAATFSRLAPSTDTLNKAHQFHSDAIYDQPQGKAQLAVTEYMSLEREQKRDAIRDMMGVDLYA